MGASRVHERLESNKVVMFYGPKGCGKKMMAQCVINEVGGLFIDLSPACLVENSAYIPSTPADITLLMHMVFKVAKAMAPSVILMNDVEYFFGKKVKKSKDQDSPPLIVPGTISKTIKKCLKKELKDLNPGDRVLIIATSSDPLAGKSFFSFINQSIYFPPPNYAARMLLWKQLLSNAIGHLQSAPNINFSDLARITEGYSAADICAVSNAVFKSQRIMDLNKKPLQISEFVHELSKFTPALNLPQHELYEAVEAKIEIPKLVEPDEKKKKTLAAVKPKKS